MTIKRFISYSLVIPLVISLGIHLFAMSFVFIHPARKESRPEPFFARIVTPDEIGLSGGGIPETPASVPRNLTPLPYERSMPPAAEKTAPSPESSEKHVLSPSPQESSPHDFSFPLSKKDLLDRDIIAKSIKKEAGERPKSVITFDVNELRYYGYRKMLKEKIEGIWQYPSDAEMRGIYGDLYINFTIKKNGALGNVELVRTSGYKSLDDAAIKALKDAAPFWPLPEEWKQDSLTIEGHFIYSPYYRPYIR